MGNAGQAGRALEVRWKNGGLAVDDLGLAMMGHRNYAIDVLGFSVRAPQERGGDFLISVRGVQDDGTRVVGFHGAPDLMDAFVGLDNRLKNGTMRWQVDQFIR